MEKFAYTGVIGIAVNYFPSEVLAIMFEFPFDVGKLGVKLISLGLPRHTKITIRILFSHSSTPQHIRSFYPQDTCIEE